MYKATKQAKENAEYKRQRLRFDENFVQVLRCRFQLDDNDSTQVVIEGIFGYTSANF